MADANTEVDLDKLNAAIVADIKAQFPAYRTVEFYDKVRKELKLPAILLELSEFDAAPEIDPGTEQLAVEGRFAARVVIDSLRVAAPANPKQEVRKAAAALAAWLRVRRWTNPDDAGKKLPTGPAEVIGASPDDFEPELDQMEVWRVEWRQVIHLGETIWKGEGVMPSEVFVGWNPDIGEGNEGDYQNVETGQPPAP